MARTTPDLLTLQSAALVAEHLRQPAGIAQDDVTGAPIFDFDPPLTAGEAVRLARLLRLARFRFLNIAPAEWQALEPAIAEIRTFRTRTAAEWSAMTAAQRDNALIQWCQDITDVLRAMLRD